MKGYDVAFNICKKINEDEEVINENVLIYPSGWRDDFYCISIKNISESTDVESISDKIKQIASGYDGWTFLKEEFDESLLIKEIHYSLDDE